MSDMKRFPFKFLFALVVIGMLVACGGDDPAETPPTSPTETATPTGTPSSATATPSADRGDVPDGEPGAELPPVEPQIVEETADGQGVIYSISFDSRPDGFSFRNYGPDHPQGDFTVDEVREMFGDGVCSRIDEDTGTCIPLAETQQWIDDRNADMRAGHCIGFTVTSYRFAGDELQPADFSPAAQTPYEIDQRIPIMREIALNGSLYWVKSVWSSEVAGGPRDIIDGLIALQEPVDLSIFLPGLVGGHSLLAYGVEEVAPGQYHILVYDNNFPGRDLFVEVDYEANTWRYAQGAVNPDQTAVPYEGDATTQTLRYIPLSAYDSVECPFCPPGSQSAPEEDDAGELLNLISVLGKGEILVKTALGNIGMVAGEIINELPGAFLIFPRGQLAADGAPAVSLPAGTEYTIEFNRLERVSSLGPGVSVVLDDLKPESDENRLVVAPDGQTVEFQAGGKQSPSVTVTVRQDDATYNVTLLGVDFEKGQGLTMGAGGGGQGIELRSQDVDVADATLLIARLTDEEEAIFATGELNISDGGGVTLDVEEWDGTGSIDVYEDENGDGEYDETPVELENEPLDELLEDSDVAGIQTIISTLSPFLGSEGVEALLASLADKDITGAEIGRLLRPFDLTDEQLIAIIPPLELPLPEVGDLLFELRLEEERVEVVSEGLELETEDETELLSYLADLALFHSITSDWEFLKTDDLSQLVALLAGHNLSAARLAQLLPRLGLDEEQIDQVLRDLALSEADLEEIVDALGIDLPATSTPTPTPTAGTSISLTLTVTPTMTMTPTPTVTTTPTIAATPDATPTLSPYPGPLPSPTGGPGGYPYPGPLPSPTGGPGGYPVPSATPDYDSRAFCDGDALRVIAEEPTWGADFVIELWAGDALLFTGAIGPEGEPLVVTLPGPGTWTDLHLIALEEPKRVPLGTISCPE